MIKRLFVIPTFPFPRSSTRFTIRRNISVIPEAFKNNLMPGYLENLDIENTYKGYLNG
jgi:hypothetical protein